MSHFQVPVKLYMSSPVLSVRPEASLEEAYEVMVEGRISALPVLDSQRVVEGLITRSDLLRIGRTEAGSRPDSHVLAFPDRKVSAEMTREVQTVSPDMTLEVAAGMMARGRIHRVVVTEDARAIGLLSTRDLMRAIAEKEMSHPISEFMSSPVFTIRAEEGLGMAVERLEKARVSGLVVVEDDWAVGVFTQAEALEARHLPRGTAVGDAMNPRILTLAPRTRMHRAAAQAAATGVRRVVIQEGESLVGILSGLDFAQAML